MSLPDRVRVLQVVPSFMPGGAEHMVVHLTCALDSSQFDVAVVSLYGPSGSELETQLAALRLPVWYLGKRRGPDPRVFWRLDKVLRTFRPHVVHTHLSALFYALPTMLFRRVPMKIYTVHTIAEKLFPGPLGWTFPFKRWVVPVSIAREVSKSMWRVWRIKDPPIVPNGIPVTLYRTPTMSRSEWRARERFSDMDILLVCVASLGSAKNHSLLLDAFASGPSRDPRVHLLLAGQGELLEPLCRKAAQLGIRSQVHFLGIRRDIPDLLGAGDLFVLSSNHEGNPLCIMEAMAAGLPVVSTAVGGVPELLRHGVEGLLVQPGNVGALAQAISLLVESEELRRSMGSRAARRAAETFDASLMANAYADLYKAGLLACRGGAGRFLEQHISRT